MSPWALLALPLALVPLLLAWRGRRKGRPVSFSSTYLLERIRPIRSRAVERSPWIVVLRCLIVLALVLTAARPVAPGGADDPAAHLPTRVVVIVDVSGSVAQLVDGDPVWLDIRAAADSLLALAGKDDRVILATVADGLTGWWEAPVADLRRRLARLEPTARPSDWPATLAGLARRLEEGTEAYLLTDGSSGWRPPDPSTARASGEERPSPAPGHRVVRAWIDEPPENRGLIGVRWLDAERAVPVGVRWASSPSGGTATAGRWVDGALVEPAAIALDGAPAAATWTIADSATFALAPGDPFPEDDRFFVARGTRGPYRVVRWIRDDEGSEPGTLFWEAALGAIGDGVTVERMATLEALEAATPRLALLPLRRYRPDEAAALARLAAGGTRLLFVPSCAAPACVPGSDWLPAEGLDVPAIKWSLDEESRRTSLVERPDLNGDAAATGVPGHLLERAPLRNALSVTGGPRPEWTWPTADRRAAALWVRGPLALWLVPLGPPVTRLGTTPVFPLVADAALAAWDPAWRRGAGIRVGEAPPLPIEGSVLRGPLGRPGPGTWRIAAGARAPRLERPGLYHVEAAGGVRETEREASFVAVNRVPGEGDLAPVSTATWRAAWGEPVPAAAWRGALFPRRRGAEIAPWLLSLALALLAVEALVRRARTPS